MSGAGDIAPGPLSVCDWCASERQPAVYTSWVALSKATPQDSVLAVVPSSHFLSGWHGTKKGTGLPKDFDPDKCVWMVPEQLLPGDVILFNIKTVHAATPNKSTPRRYRVRYACWLANATAFCALCFSAATRVSICCRRERGATARARGKETRRVRAGARARAIERGRACVGQDNLMCRERSKPRSIATMVSNMSLVCNQSLRCDWKSVIHVVWWKHHGSYKSHRPVASVASFVVPQRVLEPYPLPPSVRPNSVCATTARWSSETASTSSENVS